jgi:hypothetical protein
MKTKIRRIILIIKTQFIQHCLCIIGNARMTPMHAKTRDDILKNTMHTTHSKIRNARVIQMKAKEKILLMIKTQYMVVYIQHTL